MCSSLQSLSDITNLFSSGHCPLLSSRAPKKRKTFIQFHTVRFLKRIEPKSWIDLLGPGDDSDVLIGGGAVCWRVVMKVTNKIWKSYI